MIVASHPGDAPWTMLPATPALPTPRREGRVPAPGADLWYGEYGIDHGGTPVLLLHGGLGSSAYFGDLIKRLADAGHHVVALDTRGHGRSGASSLPYSYERLAADVVVLLDHLGIARADVVGWSDGGTAGYQLAITAPGRVNRLLAFGANARQSGLIDGYDGTPNFVAYVARTEEEYRDAAAYPQFLEQIAGMWDSEPSISDEDLGTIPVPVTVAVGQYDEGIDRYHAQDVANAIPNANLVVLPDVSHFAMLQKPALFAELVENFLRWR